MEHKEQEFKEMTLDEMKVLAFDLAHFPPISVDNRRVTEALTRLIMVSEIRMRDLRAFREYAEKVSAGLRYIDCQVQDAGRDGISSYEVKQRLEGLVPFITKFRATLNEDEIKPRLEGFGEDESDG